MVTGLPVVREGAAPDNITQHNETDMDETYNNNTSINDGASMDGHDPYAPMPISSRHFDGRDNQKVGAQFSKPAMLSMNMS